MQSQRLRFVVKFQEKAEVFDSETGDVSHQWVTAYLDSNTPLDSVPAEVLTGPGREMKAADAKQSETSARINVRWFNGLSPAWRILWDGRVYDIISIETDRTARLEWRLICKDGVNDGG